MKIEIGKKYIDNIGDQYLIIADMDDYDISVKSRRFLGLHNSDTSYITSFDKDGQGKDRCLIEEVIFRGGSTEYVLKSIDSLFEKLPPADLLTFIEQISEKIKIKYDKNKSPQPRPDFVNVMMKIISGE